MVEKEELKTDQANIEQTASGKKRKHRFATSARPITSVRSIDIDPIILLTTVHNVLFVQYVFLPTKQAETYLKIYVLICHSTYIYPSFFSWKQNLIFKETVTFKL